MLGRPSKVLSAENQLNSIDDVSILKNLQLSTCLFSKKES